MITRDRDFTGRICSVCLGAHGDKHVYCVVKGVTVTSLIAIEHAIPLILNLPGAIIASQDHLGIFIR